MQTPRILLRNDGQISNALVESTRYEYEWGTKVSHNTDRGLNACFWETKNRARQTTPLS